MLDPILHNDAVSFGDERLVVADLVLLGLITGTWERFERDVRRGLALELTNGRLFGARERKACATEFRYAHGLLSAHEFTSWLAERSLTVADLSGVLGRRWLRERMPDGDAETDVEASALAGVLRVEALCNGVLQMLALDAIERIAAAHLLGAADRAVGDGRVAETLADALGRTASGIAALGPSELRQRLGRLWTYEDARAALRKQVSEPVALERRLAEHGLEWLRLDGRRMRFATMSAAREARALIRDDGLAAEEVGLIAGSVVSAESVYLDEVPRQIAGILAATAPGEASPPWLQDDEWHVLVVGSKTAPSVQDPVLRERAADELLAEVLRRHAAGRARLHGAF
ncbi:MAG: hypothetical protein ACLP50_26570 [Solirubrobacteraceae bacterium]